MGKLLDDFISFAFSLGVDVIVILSLKSTELRLKLNTKIVYTPPTTTNNHHPLPNKLF